MNTTEYFRNRTEDLMRVEDIELMSESYIKAAYIKEDDGCLDNDKLDAAITQITSFKTTLIKLREEEGVSKI